MHAYIIVGKNEDCVEDQVVKLIRQLKAKRLDYSLLKIEEARELGKFTKLTLAEPTVIVLKNVGDASKETLNAFLKNLEEPQNNLYYILATKSIHNVLPTIISRCSVIRVTDKIELDKEITKNLNTFIKSNISEKLIITGYIRKKDEAINFIESYIVLCHQNLISSSTIDSNLAKSLARAEKTLSNLKANGNVQLQLTNFVINI